MGLGNNSNFKYISVTLMNIKKAEDKAYLESYDYDSKEKGEHDFVEGSLMKIKFSTNNAE